MAVTPVGNPYVESSDRVSDYPGASEALAERIDIVGVNPFADSAARATAIPSPTEGMMSSLNDTDAVERYDGATWKPVGGKVLQVVSVFKADTFTTSSTSFVDVTGLTASITPSATSSKILVLATIAYATTVGGYTARAALIRDSTQIGGGTAVGSRGTANARTRQEDATTNIAPTSFNFVDSPNTTLATTYKIQVAGQSGSSVIVGTSAGSDVNAVEQPRLSCTIILMEISA